MPHADSLEGTIDERIALIIVRAGLKGPASHAILSAAPFITKVVKFLTPISAVLFYRGLSDEHWLGAFLAYNGLLFTLLAFAIVEGFACGTSSSATEAGNTTISRVIAQVAAVSPRRFVTLRSVATNPARLIRHIGMVAASTVGILFVFALCAGFESAIPRGIARVVENLSIGILLLTYLAVFTLLFSQYVREAGGDRSMRFGSGLKLFALFLGSLCFVGLPFTILWFPAALSRAKGLDIVQKASADTPSAESPEVAAAVERESAPFLETPKTAERPSTWAIESTGALRAEVTSADAAARLAKLIGVSEEKAETLLRIGPRVIRRGLSIDQAQSWVSRLDTTGAIFRSIDLDPANGTQAQQQAAVVSRSPSPSPLEPIPIRQPASAQDPRPLAAASDIKASPTDAQRARRATTIAALLIVSVAFAAWAVFHRGQPPTPAETVSASVPRLNQPELATTKPNSSRPAVAGRVGSESMVQTRIQVTGRLSCGNRSCGFVAENYDISLEPDSAEAIRIYEVCADELCSLDALIETIRKVSSEIPQSFVKKVFNVGVSPAAVASTASFEAKWLERQREYERRLNDTISTNSTSPRLPNKAEIIKILFNIEAQERSPVIIDGALVDTWFQGTFNKGSDTILLTLVASRKLQPNTSKIATCMYCDSEISTVLHTLGDSEWKLVSSRKGLFNIGMYGWPGVPVVDFYPTQRGMLFAIDTYSASAGEVSRGKQLITFGNGDWSGGDYVGLDTGEEGSCGDLACWSEVGRIKSADEENSLFPTLVVTFKPTKRNSVRTLARTELFQHVYDEQFRREKYKKMPLSSSDLN